MQQGGINKAKRKIEEDYEKGLEVELLKMWQIPKLDYIKDLNHDDIEPEIQKLPIRLKAFIRRYIMKNKLENGTTSEPRHVPEFHPTTVTYGTRVEEDEDITIEYPEEVATPPPTIQKSIQCPKTPKNMAREVKSADVF